MLIAIRHGKTALNEDGSERTRGWLPIPLTLEGMKEMVETAESLSEASGDISALYCSDLVRAVQSAEEVAHALSMEIQPREELRDWNIGEFAGEEINKILDKLHGFIDDPNKKVPGGESFQFFLERCVPFLHELVEADDICIAVSHNRVVTLLKALSVNKGKYPDTATLKRKGPINPAGIMILQQDWSISYMSNKNS